MLWLQGRQLVQIALKKRLPVLTVEDMASWPQFLRSVQGWYFSLVSCFTSRQSAPIFTMFMIFLWLFAFLLVDLFVTCTLQKYKILLCKAKVFMWLMCSFLGFSQEEMSSKREPLLLLHGLTPLTQKPALRNNQQFGLSLEDLTPVKKNFVQQQTDIQGALSHTRSELYR